MTLMTHLPVPAYLRLNDQPPRRKVHVAGIAQGQTLAPAVQQHQEILCQPAGIRSKTHAHHRQRKHARRTLQRIYLAQEVYEDCI